MSMPVLTALEMENKGKAQGTCMVVPREFTYR